MKHWTTTELAKLKRLYPTAPLEELEREFYPRTRESIRKAAVRFKIFARAGSKKWMAIAKQHQPSVRFL